MDSVTQSVTVYPKPTPAFTINNANQCVNGNSFVAAVEFGPKIRAYSLLAGGESGNPASSHFFDQGQMYAEGKFKDIYFYKSDVLKHAVSSYHP